MKIVKWNKISNFNESEKSIDVENEISTDVTEKLKKINEVLRVRVIA